MFHSRLMKFHHFPSVTRCTLTPACAGPLPVSAAVPVIASSVYTVAYAAGEETAIVGASWSTVNVEVA